MQKNCLEISGIGQFYKKNIMNKNLIFIYIYENEK